MNSFTVFDAEFNGFLFEADTCHMISVKTLKKDGRVVKKTFTNAPGMRDRIPEGLKYLEDQEVLVGHNICQYDLVLLKKLYPHITKWIDPVREPKRYMDTLNFSMMRWPEMQGHSLEAWAERLDLTVQKVQNDDWTKISTNMIKRCEDDVEINHEVLSYFLKVMHDDVTADSRVKWGKPIQLENQVSFIHGTQLLHGVYFKEERARQYVDVLDNRLKFLKRKILEEAPKLVKSTHTTSVKPFKKDGTFTANVQKWVTSIGITNAELVKMNIMGEFSRISIEPLNLNSRTEVIDWLKSIGWKPHQFTPKGNPKITEELRGLQGSPVGRMFSEYNVLKHRRRFLLTDDGSGGALTLVRSDGRMAAEAMTCATPTSRYRHSGKVCNAPSACVDKKTKQLIWYPNPQKTVFGTEIRDLFGVQPGNKQIGVDLSGIEARMLAHYAFNYTGGKDLANRIVSGDFHQYNADAWLVDRNSAKGGLYALMYGCGEAKLASTLGKPRSEGAALRQKFWDANPAIAELNADLELALKVNRGYIVGLDGRMVFIREGRKLLNSLLQHSAAIVFKEWMAKCYLYNTGMAHPIVSPVQMIAYHDELQFDAPTANVHLAEKYGRAYVKLAREVGTDYKLNVPLDAEAKVGMSWAECH